MNTSIVEQAAELIDSAIQPCEDLVPYIALFIGKECSLLVANPSELLTRQECLTFTASYILNNHIENELINNAYLNIKKDHRFKKLETVEILNDRLSKTIVNPIFRDVVMLLFIVAKDPHDGGFINILTRTNFKMTDDKVRFEFMAHFDEKYRSKNNFNKG